MNIYQFKIFQFFIDSYYNHDKCSDGKWHQNIQPHQEDDVHHAIILKIFCVRCRLTKNIYLVNENPTIIIIRCLRQHVDSKEGYPCVFTVSWTLGLPIIPGLDNSKKFIQSFHLYRHDTCSACRCDYGRECRGNTIWLCRYACLCFEADLSLSWRWWW